MAWGAWRARRACALAMSAWGVGAAWGAPAFVQHDPGQQVFGEPAGVTQREPEVVREAESAAIWIKTGPSFTYDRVAVYFTTDGSAPTGSRGVPSGSTQVLLSNAGGVSFVRNEPGQSGNDDWWSATLPSDTRQYGETVRYRIGVFTSSNGEPEAFATDPSDLDTVFEFTNRLAWPGAGSGSPNPGAGYPPVHFWKEEGVVGNNWINVMIDQNGSIYDVYYPGAGAVQGISTKNEGYFDGFKDQFPAGLQPGQRGQMHVNFAAVGIRPTDANGNGTTRWLSNMNGTDYTGVSQAWAGTTNVVGTTQTLVAGGQDIDVEQVDLAPKLEGSGIAYPTDGGGTPNRGLHFKLLRLTNNGASPAEVNLYFYADFALNGGDGFDGMFTDAGRGAMVAYDNTNRLAAASGEYNPTTFADYEKDVSVYLAATLRRLGSYPAPGSTPAGEFWSDTSADQGQGWIGLKATLAPGVAQHFLVGIVGGFDPFAGAMGTYAFQQAPALDWMGTADFAGMASATLGYWGEWLESGVRFGCPDPAYVELFDRGLLGTALHFDAKSGALIAGMHNGAYPFCWPRDAAWAAITLARTGHVAEAERIFEFLRDVAYRDVEGWGRKGFWKQKYTTDGYTIWGNPQVDETSCYPWGVRYIYDVTGDTGFLSAHYDEVYEAAIASSQDSTVDGNLRYEESVDLVYSMSLWEDAFDVFNYSNASVVRGLEDAAAIADVLDQSVCPGGPGTCGYHADRALFLSRSAAIRAGLDARLDWNGENTDISQLGITYPFEVYPAGHARVELIADRINGVAPDRFGAFEPIVQFGGVPEWTGLVDRYAGDGYWNGGPWFLSTMWYGAYYAMRSDLTPGTADVDNFKDRLDLLIAKLGPLGFGAEQIARDATLLYPGQADYTLQTAYPNAWESMSFFVDSVMLLLDWEPDADGNVLRVRPKLPSDWSEMSFGNIALGAHRVDIEVARDAGAKTATHRFTNVTGGALGFDTVVRVPPDVDICSVRRDGTPVVGWTFDRGLGAVAIDGALDTGPGAVTELVVRYGKAADVTGPTPGVPDGIVNTDDFIYFLILYSSGDPRANWNGVGGVNTDDFIAFLGTYAAGCE